MKATHPTDQRPHPGVQGAVRLLNLVGRSAPPHRPVGGLLHRWYAASGTDLGFDEWADVATEDLGHAFERHADLVAVEQAVVAFAEARAGADHGVAASKPKGCARPTRRPPDAALGETGPVG